MIFWKYLEIIWNYLVKWFSNRCTSFYSTETLSKKSKTTLHKSGNIIATVWFSNMPLVPPSFRPLFFLYIFPCLWNGCSDVFVVKIKKKNKLLVYVSFMHNSKMFFFSFTWNNSSFFFFYIYIWNSILKWEIKIEILIFELLIFRNKTFNIWAWSHWRVWIWFHCLLHPNHCTRVWPIESRRIHWRIDWKVCF